MKSERYFLTVLLVAIVTLSGCVSNSGLEGSRDGTVVENPPKNLTEDLTGDEVRIQAEDNDLLVAYSIRDRDLIGETEAAVEVIASNDSSRHYCPGDASGVLRVPASPNVPAEYIVSLSEDDRFLPTSPCRATDGGFGTRGSITTASWVPKSGNRSD